MRSGLESIRVKEERRPTDAPWSEEFTKQFMALKDAKIARLQELTGAACDAVVPARLFIRSVEPQWCNATADGLKPFECTSSPVLNILLRGDWVVLTKKGFCTDIGGNLRAMAVCRIQAVVQREVVRQKLLAMISPILHDALVGYLESRGKPAFNYATFDIVFDVRALKINVAALLEKGKFENPLTVVQPGKRRPDNLGRGLVHAQHGSCSDLVMYLESKGCPKTRS